MTPDVPDDLRSLPTGRGPCEECQANRRRLIGLAADVTGLRHVIDRFDDLDMTDMADRVDRLEWMLAGLLGAMIWLIWSDARRG